MSDLPVGWANATVDDVAAMEPAAITDGPFGSNLKTSHYTERGPRVIRLQNIGDGRFVDEKAHISPEHFGRLRRHEARARDVVIAMLGDPLPRACVVPDNLGPAIVKADCVRVRVHPRVATPEYLALVLNSQQVRGQATDLIHGVGRPRLGLKWLRTLTFPLAPPGEQTRLVAALDSYLSRLEAATATLERVQRNLARCRASVLKAAVEGRLVPTEAELARAEGRTYETAAALLARTAPPPRPNRWATRSRAVIRGHTALAVCNPGTPLPEGWAWAQLVDIARMESGHTPSRAHPEWWDGDVPWIGIADARENHGGTIRTTEQHTNKNGLANSAARLLPAGTVCLSRTASVGYVVVMGVPMATSQDFGNWVPSKAITPEWLKLVLMADREALLRFAEGSVHKTIYFPALLSLHVAVPPVAEQVRITTEVSRHVSVVRASEIALEQIEVRCHRLRQCILKWAFEGKLVEQDPTDEPASVLLERIKAERADVTQHATNPRKPRAKNAAKTA